MVKIIFEYNPSKLDNKIINIICKKIKISKIGDNYKFKYHTQKYQLKEIITQIFYVLYKAKNWRQVGNTWNNVYKHYIKLNSLKISNELYIDLSKKYFQINKTSLKITNLCIIHKNINWKKLLLKFFMCFTKQKIRDN